jgi:hypothetical protein
VRRALEALLAAAQLERNERIRAALGEDAAQVEASLFAVLLKVALAFTLAETGRIPQRAGTSTLAAWLGAAEDWSRRAGAGSALLFGDQRSALEDPAVIEQWLGGARLDAVSRALAGGAPGAVYEGLLALRLRRLEGASLPLGPTAACVSAATVLKEPPAVRSKWLQRELGLPKSTVQRLASALSRARTEHEMLEALAPLAVRGKQPLAAGALVIDASVHRRRSGSHYTPDALAAKVVARTLGPLVDGASSERLRSLRVCDPAMGSGAFLEQAAKLLSAALASAWHRERSGEVDGEGSIERLALGVVITECLFGVDKDAVAADLARACLAGLAAADGGAPPDLSAHLRTGDGLVGRVHVSDAPPLFPTTGLAGFDWASEFPGVFSERSAGFDACIGNPPWVAYAGRAAQPLDPALADYYGAHNPAFRGYRTLHGLFVRRAAELLRAGGRLGLVLPTSVADLAGYAPTREAHDALCDVDPDLLDFGDGAFSGVFQPCMALTSTRRQRAKDGRTSQPGAIWPLGRSDLDRGAARLLERLDELPKLPGQLFGERGLQTTGDDLSHLRKLALPAAPFVVPIREGGDVGEFRTGVPRTFLDPAGLRARFRDAAEWQAVSVLIRQTARYPIASLSDGVAFRNSILAGFAGDPWTAPALMAYLNSSVVRWFHYTRHRDARQGMPQLKIGHLRALPDIADARARQELDALGKTLGARNSGITVAERRTLDGAVEDAHRLTEAERGIVARWALANPPPVPRKAGGNLV